jgi:hypothetical protein
MRETLKLHPQSRCEALSSLTVDVRRDARGALALEYAASGAIDDIRIPRATLSARADNLWRTTCFEAFIRAEGCIGYVELNFAPTTEWAAYAFDAYRIGMRAANELAPQKIDTQRTNDAFTLLTSLDLSRFAGFSNSAWMLGLSAVIEESNGRLSYWAVTHPPGKPDFHHADCFALRLPPASTL